MHSIILTELGVVVFENEKFVKGFPFSKPSEEYVLIKKGKAEIKDLVQFLSKIDSGLEVSDQSLRSLLKRKLVDAQIMDEKQITEIQSSKPEILVKSGFAKNDSEAMEKLREFAIELSSSKISEVSESPDLHIIQGINTLDETDKIINALSSRLREWYGLHFPELDNIIDSINGYSQIVLAGKRENLSEKIYEDAGFPESKVEMLNLVSEKSHGGDISQENLGIVQRLAKQILDLFDLRKNLEENVENQMQANAPNLTAILGPAVGARILARAGSLKKLASMPASTIQVLGAEKALFRSLKTGSQPPKHGLLFQHTLVHAAPRWQRGKIARAIAAKAAIAARIDVYGGGINQVLLDKLNVRVVEIGKKYKNAPEKKEFQPRSFEKRKDFKKRSFGEKGKNKLKSKKGKYKKRKKFGRR